MGRQRFAILALPVLLTCLALVLTAVQPLAAWQPPGQRVQYPYPSTTEPPLADSAAAQPSSADPPTPVVRIQVRVAATISAGQELEYKIHVENISRADAYHVTVINSRPQHAKFVRATPEPHFSPENGEFDWEIGTLETCRSRDISLILMPDGQGDVRNCARVRYDHGQCTTTRLSTPELSIQKRGPKTGILGELLDYDIIVTNTGRMPLLNLELTDQLPEGLVHQGGKEVRRWTRARLEAGETWRESFKVEAKTVGEHCNRAIIIAGDLRRETESCVKISERQVDLELKAPAKAFTNVPTAVQLEVRNRGTETLTNLAVSAQLPAKSSLVNASRGGETLQGNEVRWVINSLAPAESKTFQYIAMLQKEGGEDTLRASVLSSRGTLARAEAKITMEPLRDTEGGHFDIVPEPGKIAVGESTAYTIWVVNQGRTPLSKIKLVAIVPKELEVQSTTPATSSTGHQIDFEPFTLQPSGSASYIVRVKALEATNDARLEVRMSADQRTETKKEASTVILPKEK